MKVTIEETCTACGMCVDTCPDVFQMGDEYAEVIVDPVPAEFEALGVRGREMGFPHVASGPLIRSSYNAEETFAAIGRSEA